MKNILRTVYKKSSLSKKMLMVFGGFILVIGIIQFIVLQISFNIYEGQIYERSLQELAFFSDRINTSIEDVESQSLGIALDSDIQNQLSEILALPSSSKKRLYDLYLFRVILINQMNTNDFILNIRYVNSDKLDFELGTYTGKLEGGEYDEFLQEIHQNQGGITLKIPTTQYPYLLLGRDLLKSLDASLDYMGTLVMTCDLASIVEEHRKTLNEQNETIYIFSDQGIVYQGSNDLPDLSKLTGEEGYKIIRHKGQKYFICYYTSDENHWTYVNEFPYGEIYGQTALMKNLMFWLFIVLFFLSFPIINKLAYTIIHPLKNLSMSMKVVEKGEFKKAKLILGEEIYQDEVGILIEEFRYMLDKIDQLIFENYEKHILVQETRYKMLQAQINPHFLYNTLNVLNWSVKAGNVDETSEMIVELGSLLRYSLEKSPYATIRDEIEAVRSYMLIQEFRYKNRAKFILSIEGEMEKYLVPRMILQPLVENSILHGMQKTLESCQVHVSVKEEDTYVFIQVRDTGIGMDDETLRKVRRFDLESKKERIGLKNIKERLFLTFQGHCQINIDSRIGEGTTVSIKISKIEERGKNV